MQRSRFSSAKGRKISPTDAGAWDHHERSGPVADDLDPTKRLEWHRAVAPWVNEVVDRLPLRRAHLRPSAFLEADVVEPELTEAGRAARAEVDSHHVVHKHQPGANFETDYAT